MTLKRYILPIILVFPVISCSDGGSSTTFSSRVSTDSAGNVFVTGAYSGTTDFDPGPGIDNHTVPGTIGMYLSKFNADGEYQWVIAWGCHESINGVRAHVDGEDNLYLCGNYRSTVDFDPSVNTEERMSEGGDDVYVAKYDSDGNFLWVQAFGGGADDIGWDMSVDSTGQVFVAGEYAGLVDFDPSAGEDNHTRWARLTFSSQMALPTHS